MQSSTELAIPVPSADEALLEKIEELSLIRELNDRLAQASTYNTACQMLVDMVRDERGADAVEYVSIDRARRLARLEASAPDEPGTQDTFDADLGDETIARLVEGNEPRLSRKVPTLPWHAAKKGARARARAGADVLISTPTRVRDVTTGLLLVYTHGDDTRLGEDVRLLSIAATSAALALDVARRDVREEFLAMLRHDINNPVSVALGYTEMLVAECRDRGQRDLLDVALSIEESLEAVADLVSNYLHMPAIDGGTPHLECHPLDLAELTAKVADRYRLHAAQKGITVECTGRSPLLLADQRPLARVLGNLLSNAIKYTRGPGRVTITCGGDDRYGTIAVADTGYGLAPDDLARLFTKHARFHRDRGIPGTGLGLFICREIVRAHGGDIEVTSALGEGSTFTVRLPIRGPGAEPIRQRAVGE
jgi:signal transduction histidine kinase